MVSLICAWTNDWANNRGAGDLRCHRAHYWNRRPANGPIWTNNVQFTDAYKCHATPLLTHWLLGNMTIILKVYFSNSLYGTVPRTLAVELLSGECHRPPRARGELLEVMAWCRQAKSHYLSQSWSRFMSRHGVTKSQWVNFDIPVRDGVYKYWWPSLLTRACVAEPQWVSIMSIYILGACKVDEKVFGSYMSRTLFHEIYPRRCSFHKSYIQGWF